VHTRHEQGAAYMALGAVRRACAPSGFAALACHRHIRPNFGTASAPSSRKAVPKQEIYSRPSSGIGYFIKHDQRLASQVSIQGWAASGNFSPQASIWRG
jgi:hypothetical protein